MCSQDFLDEGPAAAGQSSSEVPVTPYTALFDAISQATVRKALSLGLLDQTAVDILASRLPLYREVDAFRTIFEHSSLDFRRIFRDWMWNDAIAYFHRNPDYLKTVVASEAYSSEQSPLVGGSEVTRAAERLVARVARPPSPTSSDDEAAARRIRWAPVLEDVCLIPANPTA